MPTSQFGRQRPSLPHIEDRVTSWRTEVIADSSDQWAGNGLRFATRDEAQAYVSDLMDRWASVRGWRTVEGKDPPTHRYSAGRAVEIEHGQ